MGKKYIGPKNKIENSLCFNIFNRSSCNIKNKKTNNRSLSKMTDLGKLWKTKMKLLYKLDIKEGYLKKVLKDASKKSEGSLDKASSLDKLLELLERRLDNVVFKLDFAPTIKAARQLISHKHISVNGKIVNIPSYRVKVGDEISFSVKALKNDNLCKCLERNVTVCKWLNLDKEKKVGKVINLPTDEGISEVINLKDIVEFYSKQ